MDSFFLFELEAPNEVPSRSADKTESIIRVRNQVLDEFHKFTNQHCGPFIALNPLFIVLEDGWFIPTTTEKDWTGSHFFRKAKKITPKNKWDWCEKQIANDILKKFIELHDDLIVSDLMEDFRGRKKRSTEDISNFLIKTIPKVISIAYYKSIEDDFDKTADRLSSLKRRQLASWYELLLSGRNNDYVDAGHVFACVSPGNYYSGPESKYPAIAFSQNVTRKTALLMANATYLQ